MLKRNWRDNIAVGVAYVALLIIVFGASAGLILDRYADLQKGYATYQATAQRELNAAADEIARTCIDADRTKLAECFADKIKTYGEQQSANQDLRAQQDMAFWAQALFILGIGQAFLSAFGIYYVARSVRQASEGLVLARDANEVQRDIGQKQVRAYLTCSEGRYHMNEIWAYCGLFVVNSGQSPAKNVVAEVKLSTIMGMAGYIRREPAFQQMESKVVRCGGPVIAAGAKVRLNAVFDMRKLHPDVQHELRIGTGTFQIMGAVSWVDVFGNPDSSTIVLAQRLDDRETVGTESDRSGKLKTYHDHEDQ